MRAILELITEAISRNRLENNIYKEMDKRKLHKLYHDDYWQGVKDVKEMIADVIDKLNYEGYSEVYANEGGYRTSKDGMSQWKEYVVNIYSTINNEEKLELTGTLNCHAAGSQQDPFDAYDMTLVLGKA